jgi:hypothetical protein
MTPRRRNVRYIGGPQIAKKIARKGRKARSLVYIVLPVSRKEDKKTRMLIV